MFFEEKLSYQLLDTKPNKVMKNLFVALAEQGEAGSSDLVDEMLRQVQKPYEESKQTGMKQLLFSHPFVHRMLKDMIKGEIKGKSAVSVKDADGEEKTTKLKFSQTIAKILLKHFDSAINGRGVFILLELIENAETQHLVSKQLKAQKKAIKEQVKKDPRAKGLQVLLKKLD